MPFFKSAFTNTNTSVLVERTMILFHSAVLGTPRNWSWSFAVGALAYQDACRLVHLSYRFSETGSQCLNGGLAVGAAGPLQEDAYSKVGNN